MHFLFANQLASGAAGDSSDTAAPRRAAPTGALRIARHVGPITPPAPFQMKPSCVRRYERHPTRCLPANPFDLHSSFHSSQTRSASRLPPAVPVHSAAPAPPAGRRPSCGNVSVMSERQIRSILLNLLSRFLLLKLHSVGAGTHLVALLVKTTSSYGYTRGGGGWGGV